VTTGSGTVFAWTALRATNGALGIRADKLAGKSAVSNSLPLTYSKKEAWTRQVEANYSTTELLEKWRKFNFIRAVILMFGTVIGAYALVYETGA
jgi:hypothetical protein